MSDSVSGEEEEEVDSEETEEYRLVRKSDWEGDREGEIDAVVGIKVVICWRCFCSASCRECSRKYSCKAKAPSGSFCVGFQKTDIVSIYYFKLLT